MALASLSVFSQDYTKSNRFKKQFALVDLVGDCVYGSDVDCRSAIYRSLSLGSTSHEIVQAVTAEVEKIKNVDKGSIDSSKDRLRNLFEKADEEFDTTFYESMNILNSL